MDRRDSIYYWLIFWINPVLSFLLTLKKLRDPIAMNIFWGFCIFFGFTFAIGFESQGSDIVVYISKIKELYGLPMDWNYLKTYFQLEGDIDYYSTVIAVLLSRFTDNQRIITMFYAVIYGYFYSRNIWFVIGKLKYKFNFLSILLLIVLFLILPIWYLNGVRMWTAMHMFIFGLLPYVWDGNKKRLFFLYGSVLVHFSFYPIVLAFLLYRIIGNRVTVYFAFFCLSWFISEGDFETLNNLIEAFAPQSFQDRTYGYRAESTIESMAEEGQNYALNWYVEGHLLVLKWALSLSLIIVYFKRNIFLAEDKILTRVFCNSLFFFGISNIVSVIPSGGRFSSMSYFLATSLILVIVNMIQYPSMLSKANKLMLPAYVLFIVVAVRMGIYSLSPQTFFANPVIMTFYTEDTTSINDFIK